MDSSWCFRNIKAFVHNLKIGFRLWNQYYGYIPFQNGGSGKYCIQQHGEFRINWSSSLCSLNELERNVQVLYFMLLRTVILNWWSNTISTKSMIFSLWQKRRSVHINVPRMSMSQWRSGWLILVQNSKTGSIKNIPHV